jgi:hypothetical protein
VQWQETLWPIFPMVTRDMRISENFPEYISPLVDCTGGWYMALKDHLKENHFHQAGFSNVSRHIPPLVPYLTKTETDQGLWAIGEVAESFMAKTQDSEARRRLGEMPERAAQYVRGGGFMGYKTAIFIARKPVES